MDLTPKKVHLRTNNMLIPIEQLTSKETKNIDVYSLKFYNFNYLLID